MAKKNMIAKKPKKLIAGKYSHYKIGTILSVQSGMAVLDRVPKDGIRAKKKWIAYEIVKADRVDSPKEMPQDEAWHEITLNVRYPDGTTGRRECSTQDPTTLPLVAYLVQPEQG